MSKHSVARISRGGQVTVPAAVRHRWGTDRIAVEDHGNHLLVRPLPDPISAFIGFAGARDGPTAERARALSRSEDARAERASR
jgi:bifunctional DNA-binding transcriptional regulator/antitoxin component of YhaV-PrlF toxin-antitoxin module